MNVVVVIPAKGDSKRLEKKNIYTLWGKPLLGWAIKACKDSEYVTDVWVCTEDVDVQAVAHAYDVKVLPRPKALCGEVYKQAVIRYAYKSVSTFYPEDTIWVSLQSNSPEVTGEMLDKGIQKLLKYNKDEIFTVDSDGNQNAAFRVFRGGYTLQRDLSTNCGTIYVGDLLDVHDAEDISKLEAMREEEKCQ